MIKTGIRCFLNIRCEFDSRRDHRYILQPIVIQIITMGFLLKFAYGLNGIMNGITTIERMEHWAENHQNNTSAKMTLYPDPI